MTTADNRKPAAMKPILFGILVVIQLLVAWSVVAQASAEASTKQQSAIQLHISPVVHENTDRTNSAIAVIPRSLDFGSVAVGRSRSLTLMVQNPGRGILNGTAKVSAPFSIIAGGIYSLGSNQSQMIEVQYDPEAVGMNVTAVRLTGGSGTKITVAGVAVPARHVAPAPSQSASLVAGP